MAARIASPDPRNSLNPFLGIGPDLTSSDCQRGFNELIWDAVFLLTVGSFLFTVELFY